MPRISSTNWLRRRIPLVTNDISDSGTCLVIILAEGADIVTDNGTCTFVISPTTASEGIGDALTQAVVILMTGSHVVEGDAEPEPPPPPPPPSGQFSWIGSSDYAAQMRMEDQALADRMEREGW